MKKITSLKELQAIPHMWRVLDSTYDVAHKDEYKEIIGQDLKEFKINHLEKRVHLEKGNTLYHFNRSDLQPLTPVQYKGRYVGVGDEVRFSGAWYEVFGWAVHKEEVCLTVALLSSYKTTYFLQEDEIQDIRPLYPQKDTETIKIGNNVYNKQEVEEALANVKSL